jgi:Transposase DNA-binding
MDGDRRQGAASFGEVHFSTARLGDARRTKRLVKTADLIMEHPGGTLPQKLSHWSDLVGLYRLLSAQQVTHRAVIDSHCQRTLQLAATCDQVVLFLHDSTELDYTHLPALAGQLGRIGNGGGRGYVCHNTLAVTVTADGGRAVLGLANQTLHRRRAVPRGETPTQKRQHPRRESLLWPAACAAMDALCPRPPAGSTWVDVADRGADTFEFLQYLHDRGRRYVIRSARDRCLAGEDHLACDRVHQRLLAHTRDLPTLGERTIAVPRQQKSKRKAKREARDARVRIAAGPVSVRLPQFARGHADAPSLDLWVVHVREIDPPPAGAEPLEWVLLSNVATATLEQAIERIEWYRCRPIIEELHKGMKSGCGVESMQLEHAERLEPAIALLSVVAAVLLQLRQAARRPQAHTTPATAIVPRLFVRVLSGWRDKQVRDDLSVYDFTMALAKLGGHLNRKRDGFPGWLTLWRGWQDLQLMVRGAEAMRCV